MSSDRKIIRKILYLLEDIKESKPKLAEIELIKDKSGVIIGYKLKIVADEKPGLRLVKLDDPKPS